MTRFFGSALVISSLLLSGGVASAQTTTTTVGTPCYTPGSVDLTIGSTGSDVVALQTVLVAGGYLVMPAGTSMGYFGSATKAAVMKFQQDSGVRPVSGYVGPLTRAKLNERFGCSTTTTTTTTMQQPVSTTAGVATNYSYGYLTDGTYITFLRQTDGTLIVQSPESLKGRTVTRNTDGKYSLVGTVAKAIKVLTPNGGEIWKLGEQQTITWQTTGSIPEVQIGLRDQRYSTELGSGEETIVWRMQNSGSFTFIPTADSLHNLSLQNIGGNNYRVIVYGVDTSGIADTSDALFTIQSSSAQAPTGTLTITNPATGVSAGDGGTITVPATTNSYTGTPVTIAWSTQNVTGCAVANVGGQFFAGNGLTGSKTFAPKVDTTIRLNCLDVKENVVLTKTVSIHILPTTTTTTPTPTTPAPTGTLTITSGAMTSSTVTLPNSGPITLNWTSTGVQSCVVRDGASFYVNALSGTKSITPKQTTTYTLECFKDSVQVVTRTATVTVAPAPSSANILDYNNDSKVDTADAQFLTEVAVGSRTCPAGKICDVNADGKVNSTDASMFMKYMGTTGIIPACVGNAQYNSITGALCPYTTTTTTTTAAELTPSGTFTVSGGGGSASAGGTITVPDTTSYAGTPLTVAWSTQNVANCSIKTSAGGIIGGPQTAGSVTYAPKQSTTLSLLCLDTAGVTVLTKSVNIVVTPLAISGYVKVNGAASASVASGAPLTVTWHATGAQSCTMKAEYPLNQSYVSTFNATAHTGLDGSVVDHPTQATTVYKMQCFSATGGLTLTRTAIVGVSQPAVMGASTSAVASDNVCSTFTSSLQKGMSGAGVSSLQSALTKDGEGVETTGYFGVLTDAAVRAFQEKYASEILTPNGLQQGTGLVGPSTRAKLNALSGCAS